MCERVYVCVFWGAGGTLLLQGSFSQQTYPGLSSVLAPTKGPPCVSLSGTPQDL